MESRHDHSLAALGPGKIASRTSSIGGGLAPDPISIYMVARRNRCILAGNETPESLHAPSYFTD
jgi:hypothetical protein